MNNKNIPLFTKWSVLQILLALGALGVLIAKLVNGLGSVTNLTDNWPWGLWVAFDVGAYIATAAAGFAIAAIVYIFRIERFRPLVRPAILLGALFYTIAGIGIFTDLGRSINIVHPIWMWQHTSIMFEVSWCVMAYLTVLYLEFSPNIFHRFKLNISTKVQHFLVIPLVIAGIMLSFLHQSSLGALFLITPDQHPLWYQPESGYLFLISAVALGLSVLALVSIVTAKAWKMTLRMDLLSSVGKIVAWVLVVYLGVRLVELAAIGNLSEFTLDEFGWLFIAEVGIGMALPVILLSMKKVRNSVGGLSTAAVLVVMGVILNRVMVLVVSHAPGREGSYFPSATEFLYTIGLVAGVLFVYRVAAKYLPLFQEHYQGIPNATPEKHPDVIEA
jgi:Ni/Fe-hydrogenase subunit HybB-like protein